MSELWGALLAAFFLLVDWAQEALPFITALATIALAWVTWTLAKATRNMASASQPFVTATIEWNAWSMRHCDLVLQNTGDVPAFDIEVRITPSIRSDIRKGLGMPLQKVSILRPGQSMKSFLAATEEIVGETHRIELDWRRKPGARRTMSVAYEHCLPREVTRLGSSDPTTQIAEQVKKIREDWMPIALQKQNEHPRGKRPDA